MKIKNIIIIILTLIFGVVETWGQTEISFPESSEKNYQTVELSAGTIYKVSESKTFYGTISIPTGAPVTIYIPEGVTLTIHGKDASDGTKGSDAARGTENAANGTGGEGAKPAISVPSGSTLIITGGGILNATGGNAGSGGDGGKGDDGQLSWLTLGDVAGGGGAGGGGGGGASPAIGGSGGKGGTGGSGGRYGDNSFIGLWGKGSGGAGGSSVNNNTSGTNMGEVYIIGNVTIQTTKGSNEEKTNGNYGGNGNYARNKIITETGNFYQGGRGGIGGYSGSIPTYSIGGGGNGGYGGDGGKGGDVSNNDDTSNTTPNENVEGSADNGILYIQNSSQNTPDLGESTHAHASEIHIPTSENPMPEAVKTSFKIGDNIIKSVYYGTAIENMTIAVPETSTGYSFDGCWIKDTDIKVYDNEGNFVYFGEYITNGMSLFTPGIIQFEVRQVANQYTVTFDAQSGTVTLSDKQVTFDSTYGDLPTPTRTGYTFTGWFTAETDGTEVKSTSAVTTASDHTLYAYWTANTYQVSFNSNGGDEIPPIDVTYDGTYENLPDATRYGYNFDGWYTAEEGGTKIAKTTKVDITSAITLYAHWTRIKYTIRFNVNYEGGNVTEIEEEYGNNYILPDEPSRTGYTFDGWYTAKTDGTKVESTNVVTTADDHTLYAHWTANQYDVTYNANGGKVDDQDEKIIKETYDQKYTCPEPTRYGYDFDGWYTEGGEKIEKTDEVDITSDMTLYAHWSPKATNFEAYTASGLGGYYFRSFFDSRVAYEMPDKVMAFTAKVDNDYLLLTAIDGNVIPKGAPVILRAEESAIVQDGGKNCITLVTSESGKSISAENVLLGTDDDMDSHSDNCYILSHGSKGLGFYKWPTTKTLEAHKAYYIDGGSSSAKALIFRFEDEATGINNEIIDSASDESEPVIYNLSGIRISKPQKGINIIKGKKVWVPGDR